MNIRIITKYFRWGGILMILILAARHGVSAQDNVTPRTTGASQSKAGDNGQSQSKSATQTQSGDDKPTPPDALDHAKAAESTDKAPDYILPDLPRGWNKFDSKYASLMLSFAPIIDFTTYKQDEDSKAQFGELNSDWDLRSGRFLFIGDLKFKRPLHYYFSVEYNGLDRPPEQPGWGITDLWFSILLSKKVGTLSFGKLKEPFTYEVAGDSANLPYMERILTPFFKTRNIGVKLSNSVADERVTWSVGWFNDWFSAGDPFDESGNQFSGRVTYLPYISDEGDRYLHIGMSQRYSGADKDKIRLRGRPESNVAPNFVDTGDIPASFQTELAFESLWTNRAFSVMGEYIRSRVDSPETGNPQFYGAYICATWTITGEHRPYDRKVGYARRIIPERRWGAWEVVARYSHIDLNDRGIRGGIMDKGYLGLNWWASRQWKFGFGYGLANANRSDKQSLTHLFLTRFQWVF